MRSFLNLLSVVLILGWLLGCTQGGGMLPGGGAMDGGGQSADGGDGSDPGGGGAQPSMGELGSADTNPGTGDETPDDEMGFKMNTGDGDDPGTPTGNDNIKAMEGPDSGDDAFFDDNDEDDDEYQDTIELNAGI